MSKRIRQSVRRMHGYTPGEQPKTPGIVKLNTNENPYPPSPRVARALRTVDPARLRLYPDPVSMELRRRIAAIHRCEVDQVFVGNGSDEVLALCTRAFVEDDGSIGYFHPSYSLYPVLADIRDVAKKPVELGDRFAWQMPKGYRCSLFFLANPNAPTAVLYPRRTVRDFCRRFPGVVVIDEAYVDFARAHCMDLALSLPNVLVARTLSKSFSLAGLRLGYAVGSRDLIGAMYKLKDSYNLDRLTQAVALAALTDLPWMRRNVGRIKAMRERLSRELRALGHEVGRSDTNFLWVKPRGIRAQSLFEALRRHRILVRYFPGDRTGDYVRITVGTPAEVGKLVKAARALAAEGNRA